MHDIGDVALFEMYAYLRAHTIVEFVIKNSCVDWGGLDCLQRTLKGHGFDHRRTGILKGYADIKCNKHFVFNKQNGSSCEDLIIHW